MCQWNCQSWGSEPKTPQIQDRVTGVPASVDGWKVSLHLAQQLRNFSVNRSFDFNA